ncbi:MAG: MFS transporter [Actinobacteria bacterium]|nr:MAG: MFS transporter [Actinomycetota bacterium]
MAQVITAERPAADRTDRRKWWVLVAMVFGLFMPMLDNLVVNVALPTIQRQLGAGVSGLQWIIDAYTLTFASFMLTGGALGDLYGRRRFFMGGLITFTIGSLLCALSQSIGQLVAFRALQGLGAAMLLPGSLSIITATFSGRERGSAIGIWAAMSGLAIAIGPVIGGFLVEHVSWQSIFWINVPIGAIGLTMTALVVRESRDPSKSRRLDPAGLITGTSGLFFLVYALIEGNARGWTDGLILGGFALSAVLLAVFFYIESHRESPMLPLSFFRIPTFAAANIEAAAVFFAMFGTVFFLTLYLQNVEGYSPVAAGIRLFAFSVVILVVAPLAGRLSDRFGSRWFMTIGPLIAAGGMGLMLRTDVGSSYATVILPSFLVLAAGMALTMTPMTAAVMGSVPTRNAGVASAATNTSREIGGVFGIALLGAIVTSAFKRGFLARLTETGLSRAQATSIVSKAGASAAAGNAQLGTDGAALTQAVQNSFVHAIHIGILVSIGFLILASIVSALFVRSHVGNHDEEAAANGH